MAVGTVADVVALVMDRSQSMNVNQRSAQADRALAAIKSQLAGQPDLIVRQTEVTTTTSGENNGTEAFAALNSALADVQNALSNREALARQGEWLAGSLASARQVEAMTEVRYRHGAVALKDWLDAQETRRTAEVALAENQLARLQNQVTLYQALGGGV